MTYGSGRHIQHEYDAELTSLQPLVMAMGGRVEDQRARRRRALVTRDASLGDEVCTADYRVNSLEVRIDEEVTRIIARRQPAGSDLRFPMAAIRTGTDLERVGDEAEKPGRFAIEFVAGPRQRTVARARPPGRCRAARAPRCPGCIRARRRPPGLDGRGSRHPRVRCGDPRADHVRDGGFAHDAARVARAVVRARERIGDHASNVCEAVVCMVAGENIRHEQDKGPARA